MFQFILNVLDWAEDQTLFKQVKFSYTKLGE